MHIVLLIVRNIILSPYYFHSSVYVFTAFFCINLQQFMLTSYHYSFVHLNGMRMFHNLTGKMENFTNLLDSMCRSSYMEF